MNIRIMIFVCLSICFVLDPYVIAADKTIVLPLDHLYVIPIQNAKNPNGFNCTGNEECLSGYCVDDVCCNSACNSTCESCLSNHTGQLNGECSFIIADTDPNEECSETHVCNGTGQCTTCSDSIKNGGETDVDCGEVACGIYTCEAGQTCETNNDCILPMACHDLGTVKWCF